MEIPLHKVFEKQKTRFLRFDDIKDIYKTDFGYY